MVRINRWMGVTAVTASLVIAMSACSPAIPPSGGSSGAAGATDPAITVDLQAYSANLDPGLQYNTDTYSVYRNIFDQLLHRDSATNKITPWLATKWTQPDPTTWEFTLRDDVKFSDGTPLTAADAAFSIERILDPKFASAQSANFAAIDSASGDGNTLTIKTKYPSPTLLTYLTTLSVVPQAYVKKVGDLEFNKKPIGSGAYTFVSDISGSEVVLTRNDGWWGEKPQIKDVTFRAVPTLASRVADLRSGKAQLAIALTPDTASQLKGDANVGVLSAPTERVSYLAFNTIKGGPTNNPDVRDAITKAINYKSLIADLQNGLAEPVNSVLTPISEGYPKDLPNYQYDPAQAKALVEKSGEAGKTLIMATSPSYNPQIVQAVQANIEAIGLKVKIESSDQATYLKKVQNPDHDWGSIRFGQWSCSCMDADGVAYPLFRTGTVWSSYSNKDFDGLVDKARQTLDESERTKLYAQAYGILAKDAPGIGLFQVTANYGVSKKLDWKPDAQETMFISDMKLTS